MPELFVLLNVEIVFQLFTFLCAVFRKQTRKRWQFKKVLSSVRSFYFVARFIFQFELEMTKMSPDMATDFHQSRLLELLSLGAWAYFLYNVPSEIAESLTDVKEVNVLFFFFNFFHPKFVSLLIQTGIGYVRTDIDFWPHTLCNTPLFIMDKLLSLWTENCFRFYWLFHLE